MYSVEITGRAERDLRRLDRAVKNRIVESILALASNPRPPGCLKVRGEESLWRIRVGDWRVGYEIHDQRQEVLVIRIGHRSEFYT
jgi:mRNA interferase RelE/StbE